MANCHSCHSKLHQVSSHSAVFYNCRWYPRYIWCRAGVYLPPLCRSWPSATWRVYWTLCGVWDDWSGHCWHGHWCFGEAQPTDGWLAGARLWWGSQHGRQILWCAGYSEKTAATSTVECVHCGAHCSNLITQAACSASPLIRDSLFWVHQLGVLFGQSGKFKGHVCRHHNNNRQPAWANDNLETAVPNQVDCPGHSH